MKKTNKKKVSFFNNPLDYTLLITILLLLSLGLIMVLSASSPTSLAESGTSYIYKANYKYENFITKTTYKPIIEPCPITATVGFGDLVIGTSNNGAKRWIYIGGQSFQPSEFVKLFMIIFYAGLLTKDREELPKFWKGLVKHILWIAPIACLLLLEPHMSATLVISGICLVMMIVAGCKFSQLFMSGLIIGVPVIGVLIVKSSYRLKRVVTFLDPWQDKLGDGWQVIQSLYAIGSGGLFGLGLGQSKQKYLYLPEPQNDFIFSVLAEELGWAGCVFVIILFAILIWRGVLIAMKAPDMFGSLLAVGITSLIAIQVIINIAVVTSSMPATGMPLPFFSYGGTALFLLLCEMGILLNISRAGNRVD